jgi:hypothetical protein
MDDDTKPHIRNGFNDEPHPGENNQTVFGCNAKPKPKNRYLKQRESLIQRSTMCRQTRK